MNARRVVAAVAAAGALCLGIPAAAMASSGIIIVESVSSPASAPGDLSVTLESSTPVVPSSITATFFPQYSQTSVLSVADFQLTGGTNSGDTTTTWTVSSPITLSQLPLGIYTVGIQASDTGGNTVDDTDAYTLDWVVQATQTLTATPASVSYGQTVTLSGTDTGLYPDGTTEPLAGQTIYFAPGQLDQQTTTTDSNGDFSFQVQAPVGPDIDVYAAGDPPTIPATWSAIAEITIVPVPYRITDFSYGPSTANYDAPVTVTGDFSFDVGGTWQPLADDSLEITYDGINAIPCELDCQPPSDNVASGTTGSDGSFSTAISGTWGTDEYSLSPGNLDGWISGPAQTFSVKVDHVPTSTYISRLQGDTGHRVSVSGCILQSVNAVMPAIMAAYPPGAFQYADKLSGPWRTLPGAGAIPDRQVPPGNPGFCYHATERIPSGAKYYRLRTAASTAYLAAVSDPYGPPNPPQHCSTREFSVSPRTVKKGQKVKVSVELTPYVPAGAKVYVRFRADGSSHVQRVKTLSGPAESFYVSLVLPRSGYVSVRYPGDLDTYGCQTGSRHVTVR